MGCGRQKGHISKAENDDVATNLLPKIYVMTVVKDSELKLIMNDIYNEIGTGTHGDGKVFVSNIEDAMRIRTGECGENALYTKQPEGATGYNKLLHCQTRVRGGKHRTAKEHLPLFLPGIDSQWNRTV